MPRLRRQSGSQRKAASRSMMRKTRHVSGRDDGEEMMRQPDVSAEGGHDLSDGGLAHPSSRLRPSVSIEPGFDAYLKTCFEAYLNTGSEACLKTCSEPCLNTCLEACLNTCSEHCLNSFSEPCVKTCSETILKTVPYCHAKNSDTSSTTTFKDLNNTSGDDTLPSLSSKRNEISISGTDRDQTEPVHFVFGSFHQGESMFSAESSGSQCTANALCSLIYADESDITCSQDLDNILVEGDRLYNKIINGLKTKGMYQSRLLNFDEIPGHVTILGHERVVLKSDIITGLCTQQFGDSILPTLHQSVYTAFQKSSTLLVMVGSICSGMFKKGNEYFFFDSHSHGPNGLSSPDGKSLLASFYCLEDLVSFLYALYESMLIELTSQFEILPIQFTILDREHEDQLSQKNLRNAKVDSEWTFVNSQNRSKQQQQVNKDCTLGNDLIDNYFADQKKKNEQFIHAATQSESNRKQYYRTYKQQRRLSNDYKQREREYKRTARTNVHFKMKEKMYQRDSKQKTRMSGEFKEKERQSKQKSRMSSDFKEKEVHYQKQSKQRSRMSSDFKEKERQSKQRSRMSIEFKGKEVHYQKQSKQRSRLSSDFKEKERQSKERSRMSSEFKEREVHYQKQSKQRSRMSSDFKEKERQSKQKSRMSSEFKEKERQSKQKSRMSSTFKEKEVQYQKKSKQKARKDPLCLELERVAKKQRRSNAQPENIQFNCNKKALKRKNPFFHDSQQESAKQKKIDSNILSCISTFHKNISHGPVYVCSSCHQTWFRQSVSEPHSLSEAMREQFLTNLRSIDGKEWVCTTCKANILENRIPKLSVLNGMKWPDKPEQLQLFPLEERLISLRIPFMQIRELPRGRQYSVKGNVVNVPTDIQPVVDSLPRPVDENVVVPVKLKKKLSFASCAFTENVRPKNVLVALHWLMRHSELYKNANVDIDENWVKRVTEESQETLKEFIASNNGGIDTRSDDYTENVLYDSDVEENTEENVGNLDTLVDFSNLENRVETLTFAPGEGKKPLSIFQDTDSEFLCFPTIFCGQKRLQNIERQVPVHYSDIAKWELRSVDRRAANSVPNIFFKLKKIQMKQLSDKVNLAVRQCQLNGKKLTAGQVTDSSYAEEFVRKDHGYYIFKQLRNSPAYLETKKKDVFAMIRQLGLPTWFMSLSSADTRWVDLLKMLAKLNENTEYSDEEIAALSWEQKIKLVQKDPVTCSRYFDHRVQEFIKIVLRSEYKPIGVVLDFFYRVEFQQRGSPHIHMLVWIENSPKLNENTPEEITDFVDQYLSCSSEEQNFHNFIELQTHKHSRTCRKKEDKVCRFGYPLPPLNKTMILEPLETQVDKYKKKYQELQKKMNNEKEGFDMTFDEFLSNVAQMDEEEYIKCIRSSLHSSKVFIKRSPKDIRINYYNDIVLRSWKANIDMQFVLDPYACAMYIVSYISKSQRGMSALMHAACKEAKQGNLDIKRQVRHVGNIFSNSVEVSAQEAVYLVLQMPLTRSSRDVVFINTSCADKRVQLLKSSDALQELPAESTDVLCDNSIKRYAKRPKCLEHYCLADYVSELEIVYPKDSSIEECDEMNDDEMQEFQDGKTVLKLKNGIVIKRRKSQKVIRYVRFNRKTDEENHFREKLLLFYPWRHEDKDLLGNQETYKSFYETVKHSIDYKVEQYEHHAEELKQAMDIAETDEYNFDAIAPGTQEEEAITEQEQPQQSDTFIYFNPDKIAHREYDIGIEIGAGCSTATVEPTENILTDDDYRALLRSLNTKQRHFYNHVVHWLKVKDEPIYAFLSGGAGVGKSVVIKALYQTLYRMLNLKEGENPDDIRILLCAFTGKAAYNINGATISSSFMEKFKQANQTLGCDQLNTFRSKYRNLSVIIIDEISMVSNRKLSFINQRLQALTGTTAPFGGKSIIAVGDLYQLKPVADSWIFEDLSKDASSLAPNLWQDHFTMFELTQIMRQKDDLEFAQMLNRLRHNNMSDEDKKQIARCLIKPDSEHYPATAPHIFAENKYMALFNEKVILNLNAEKVTVDCHDSIIGGNISAQRQKHVLNSISSDSTRTMGLLQSLTVVVGMMYDLTINLDTEDGLNNGSPCVAQAIEYKQAETKRPSIIWVKFDETQVGRKRRKQYQSKHLYHEGIDKSWTPIFDVERTFSYNKLNVQRIQFPLQPSAGRSVYRAQGTTLDSLVVDLTQKKTRKIPHLHYVALSRVKSLKNLHIVNFNEKALQVDEKVVQEMKRLEEFAELKLCYIPLDSINSSDYYKVAFNNCRSLHKHIKDVKADQNVLSADIIAFAESRLFAGDSDDDYLIDGFHLMRNDQSLEITSVRPHHGIAVYVKHGFEIQQCISFSKEKLEFTYIAVLVAARKKQIIFVYKSPSLSMTCYKEALEKELFPLLDISHDIIILGDMNVDVSQLNNNLISWIQSKLHCRQLIQEATTDYGTTLDLIFTNCAGISGVVETYWSDHKLVFFAECLKELPVGTTENQ